MGCGSASDSPEGVVKEWGEAVNARDWARACELSIPTGPNCEARFRDGLAGVDLEFNGPAALPDQLEGEELFTFSDDRGTLFVTAVTADGETRVRFEMTLLH